MLGRLQGEIWGEPSLHVFWGGTRFSSLRKVGSCNCIEKAFERRGA